jgi:hypothetical protein
MENALTFVSVLVIMQVSEEAKQAAVAALVRRLSA